MRIRREAAQAGVDTRRAQRGRRRHIGQYVKETEQAQRDRHALLRRRGRIHMKYPGILSARDETQGARSAETEIYQ